MGFMTSIGKAVPMMHRALFNATAWVIKISGATGQLVSFITATGTLITILLTVRALADSARVYMGTIKYVVQEARYALNPWHKHKKTDLAGPNFQNPFRR
jgi:hypothetical protein